MAQADVPDASASRTRPTRSPNVNGEAGKDMKCSLRKESQCRKDDNHPYNLGDLMVSRSGKCVLRNERV